MNFHPHDGILRILPPGRDEREFYWCPREKAIEAWGDKAQENFEFTVKAYQDVGHKAKLKSKSKVFKLFSR